MKQEKFSWYVKTPFGEGGPDLIRDGSTIIGYDPKNLDYLWVKFGINKQVSEDYREANPSSPYYPDAPAWLDRETGDEEIAALDAKKAAAQTGDKTSDEEEEE